MAVAVGKYAVIVLGRRRPDGPRDRRRDEQPDQHDRRAGDKSLSCDHCGVPGGAPGPTFPWFRNAVDGERNLGPRPGVVRRLAGIDAPPEPEDVVQERLQNLRRGDVGDQRVVVGAAGHGFALGDLVFLARPGRALAMLSRFFSSIAFTEFSLSSAGASFFSLSATRPDNCRATAEVLASRLDDRLAALVEHRHQIVGVEDQRVDLLAAFGQDRR